VFNVNEILQAGGLLAVAAIVFAESGILLGLILPGDTLLLTAGVLAGRGKLDITWLIIVVIISATSSASGPGPVYSNVKKGFCCVKNIFSGLRNSLKIMAQLR
jgi:hypothetical protein